MSDTLADPIVEHLAYTRQRLRPSYTYNRGLALRGLETAIGMPLLSANRDVIEAWYAGLTVTQSSRAVMLSHVRMFYKWAVRFEWIEHNPCDRIDPPRVRRLLPRPIDAEKLEQAIATAPARIKPWFVLAAYGGLRACEVARLRAEDVMTNVDPPMLLIADGKNGKQRLVPMHVRVAEALAAADLPTTGWLFRRVRVSGVTPTSGLCDEDHVPPWLVSHHANHHLHAQNAGSTFHALRHFFGTNVYANSKDLRVTQELLGHSTPQTTAGYAAWSPARGVAAVNAIGTAND